MTNKTVRPQTDDDPVSEKPQRAADSLTAGWDIAAPPALDARSASQPSGTSFGFEGFESTPSSLSLDDFEGQPTVPPVASGSPAEHHQAPSPEYESWALQRAHDRRRRQRKKIILLISSLAGIGILAAVAVPLHKAMGPGKPVLLGKPNVRHSVVVPEFQEGFDFLVLATSEQDKNLINMRLEFVFPASNAFEEFSSKATLYRETVYQYLLRARPAKNSQKLWQSIVEKQLAEYLKQNFPRSGLQTIRVAHWERM